MLLTTAVVLFASLVFVSCQDPKLISMESFPDDFLFGVGSSAYQTEGAWNEDGKNDSMWDFITHSLPQLIADGSNGDIAADSYRKYKVDLELVKSLGVNFYRFSLSWSRILPSGLPNRINQAAVDHYNSIIDYLVANNITPIVTLVHWDLPLSLYHLGGFANPAIVDWFNDYSKVAFEKFGDRVKLWVTVNDPRMMCLYGQGYGVTALGKEAAGIGDYICSHNLLKAHARVYATYNNTHKAVQNGKVGISLNCPWFEPASNSSTDVKAAERAMFFRCGWYGHPIFSKNGDYPQVMKDFISQRSKEEGFSNSRLPTFTEEELNTIKGSFDFIGLNHYTSYIAADKEADAIGGPSCDKDMRVNLTQDLSWYNSTFSEHKSYPMGFRRTLRWLKNNYNDPEIYVTEHGWSVVAEIKDEAKVHFHSLHFSTLLDAIHTDKVRVKGYVLYSLLNQFEFYSGYTLKYGIYHVNYSDPDRTRTAKNSARFYSELIRTRKILIKSDWS